MKIFGEMCIIIGLCLCSCMYALCSMLSHYYLFLLIAVELHDLRFLMSFLRSFSCFTCLFLFYVLCVFVLFCVLFLPLYIAVSVLFLYKFTDHYHRVETHWQ